jgi:hypothetical protein
MVQYVQLGVSTAVRGGVSSRQPHGEIKESFKSFLQFQKSDPAIVPGLSVMEFKLDNEYPFKGWRCDTCIYFSVRNSTKWIVFFIEHNSICTRIISAASNAGKY